MSETSSMERNLKRLRELGFDENFLIPENLITFEKDDKGKRILIDRGSYGKVFQAILFGNKIALKESHNNGLYEEYDEDMLKDAGNEISNLSKIRHQNIVKYVGFCLPKSGKLWILTEFVEGGNLDSWLRNTKFLNKDDEDLQKLLLSLDVCEVMEFLKKKEIYHRDLKPKNVLINNGIRAEAKVCDFGLARSANKSTRHTGAGTFGWAAPEIAFGDEGVRCQFSFDSDVYSFGVLLYSIFVGKPKECPLQFGRSFDRKLSDLPNIKKIIKKCCQKNSKRRMKIEDCRTLIEKELEDETFSKDLKDIATLELGRGNPSKSLNLFRICVRGRSEFEEEIARFIRRDSDRGHPSAKLMMAEILIGGEFGFKKNKERSLDLFESSHRLTGGKLIKDKVDDIYELAGFFFHKYDHERSVRCCQILVDHNHAESQCNLGFNYDEGLGGLEKNDEKAFELFKKAADQNYANAQYNLGNMYRDGRGTSQNYAKAMEYYQKAADQNYAGAINNLGFMYANGEGCEVDLKKAFSLFIRAAEEGDVMAHYNLGEFYRDGKVCSVDLKKAKEMFEKVAAARDQNDDRKEHPYAKKAREELKKLKKK